MKALRYFIIRYSYHYTKGNENLLSFDEHYHYGYEYPHTRCIENDIKKSLFRFLHYTGIVQVTEVDYDDFVINLPENEIAKIDKMLDDNISNNIKVISDDEMAELGITQDKIDKIREHLSNSVDYDEAILRFICEVLKKYHDNEYISVPSIYYDKHNLPHDSDSDLPLLDYKRDIKNLINDFNTLLSSDDDNQKLLQSTFMRLSNIISYLWI